MAAAARVAGRGVPSSVPNPAVGALLVSPDQRVIARGWTRAGGRPHAEAEALGSAPPEAIADATLYVTLEPCAHHSKRGPACADRIVEARPARVVIGVEDPDPRTAGRGIARLREVGIEIELLDSSEARASLVGYLTRTRLGRPHVTLKLALSLDGRIALANGESRWITGEAARSHAHARRARGDAMLVGGGTWRADAPRLTARLPGLPEHAPRRLVLTRGAPPIGGGAIALPEDIGSLTDVQRLTVEGGAGAAAAFLRADLVDRLELYRAPILLGEGRPAIGDLGLERLAEAHGRWRLTETARLGPDRFEAYDRTREGGG